MELIPSIDLRRGKVVRLEQGRRDRETVYCDDPLEVLAQFQAAGATRVHVVDLDAAFGEPRQITALARIAAARKNESLEQGGGLRTEAAIREALALGFDRVVLGTLPAREPDRFEELAIGLTGRLVPAWEVEGGELRSDGWEKATDGANESFAARIRRVAEHLPAILVTDIARDGMLSGANLNLAVAVARATGVRAIVSGGLASMADVERAVAHPEAEQLAGLIVGKAFYEGRIDLAAAVRVAEGIEVSAR